MVSALRVKPREIGLDTFTKHEECRDLSVDKASMLLLVCWCGPKNPTLVVRSRHRVMEGVCPQLPSGFNRTCFSIEIRN